MICVWIVRFEVPRDFLSRLWVSYEEMQSWIRDPISFFLCDDRTFPLTPIYSLDSCAQQLNCVHSYRSTWGTQSYTRFVRPDVLGLWCDQSTELPHSTYRFSWFVFGNGFPVQWEGSARVPWGKLFLLHVSVIRCELLQLLGRWAFRPLANSWCRFTQKSSQGSNWETASL